jgi:hypothetical protein
MCLFVCVICVALKTRRVFYILEQPSTSCMKPMPNFMWMSSVTNHVRMHTWMGAFKGCAQPVFKGTHLFSTVPIKLLSHYLSRPKPVIPGKLRASQTAWKNTARWVDGQRALRDTGIYPREFAEQIANLLEALQR